MTMQELQPHQRHALRMMTEGAQSRIAQERHVLLGIGRAHV